MCMLTCLSKTGHLPVFGRPVLHETSCGFSDWSKPAGYQSWLSLHMTIRGEDTGWLPPKSTFSFNRTFRTRYHGSERKLALPPHQVPFCSPPQSQALQSDKRDMWDWILYLKLYLYTGIYTHIYWFFFPSICLHLNFGFIWILILCDFYTAFMLLFLVWASCGLHLI